MAKDTQMLKGILQGCVLAIFARGENYGYRVVELLQQSGLQNIQEASVYPLLTRLEKKGLLSFEKKAAGNGPPRKYYKLTTLGSIFLQEFYTSWSDMTHVVKQVFAPLKEEENEKPNR